MFCIYTENGQNIKTSIWEIIQIIQLPKTLMSYQKFKRKLTVSIRISEIGNRLKKFALLENEFSIDGEELTPTLKLKRKKILAKYDAVYKTIFSD